MNNKNTKVQLSTGEKLVGIEFNPSNNSTVDEIKQSCAHLINLLNHPHPSLRIDNNDNSTSEEYMLLYNKAVQDVVTAQMALVKVITFKY